VNEPPAESPSEPLGLQEADLAEEVQARSRLGERLRPKEGPGLRELVGAVVVTFQDKDHVKLTVRRLLLDLGQVVVVDLGSEDGTARALRTAFPGLDVVSLAKESGFSAAINAGMRRLTQPFVLATHGDARLRPGAVERLYDAVCDRRDMVGCAGARLVSPSGLPEQAAGFRPSPRTRLVARLRDLHPSFGRKRLKRPARFAPLVMTHVDWVSAVAMMVRRDAFEQVGGMDDGFFLAYGDMDFCLRLRRAGWRVVCEARARAIHLDRVEESRASRRAGRRRFCRRHGLRRWFVRG
jgi:GT2 family glycosyltransferase